MSEVRGNENETQQHFISYSSVIGTFAKELERMFYSLKESLDAQGVEDSGSKARHIMGLAFNTAMLSVDINHKDTNLVIRGFNSR